MDDTPIGIFEYSFSLAYEKQKDFHQKWRKVLRNLENMRGLNVPYDAGDNDVYFDLLLRQFEDEQAAYMADHKEQHLCGDRVRLQVQLTRYWLVSTAELFRTTKIAMCESHERQHEIAEYVELFGSFRIMIAKQEPQGQFANEGDIQRTVLVESPESQYSSEVSCERVSYGGKGSYREKPIFDSRNGGICFPVYDANARETRTEDRRTLSDRVLKVFGG